MHSDDDLSSFMSFSLPVKKRTKRTFQTAKNVTYIKINL